MISSCSRWLVFRAEADPVKPGHAYKDSPVANDASRVGPDRDKGPTKKHTAPPQRSYPCRIHTKDCTYHGQIWQQRHIETQACVTQHSTPISYPP